MPILYVVPSQVLGGQCDALHDVGLDDRCDDLSDDLSDDLRDVQHGDVDVRYDGPNDDEDNGQLRNLQPRKQKIKYY